MQEKEIDVLKLLKEYTALQCDRAKVKAEMFMKQAQKSTIDSKNQFMDYLKSTAKEYGQSIDETSKIYGEKDQNIGDIVKEYEDNIGKISEMFNQEYQEILEKKLKLESQVAIFNSKQVTLKEGYPAEEDFSIEKEELIQLAQMGNLEELEQKTQKLRRKISDIETRKDAIDKQNTKIQNDKIKLENIIEECNIELENCVSQMQEKMRLESVLRDEKFHNVNDKYLKILNEKKGVQKVMGWLRNKMSGQKRYAQEIITPVKNGIKELKEEKIGKLENKLSSDLTQFNEYIDKKAELIPELKEKGSKYYENAKEKGNAIKDFTIMGVKNISSEVKYKVENIAETVLEKPKKKYSEIIQKASDYKNKVIDVMVQTLEENGKEVPTKEVINIKEKEEFENEID